MSIVVLPKELSELIAAGEVIERPASVIKELVENAIDAGAHRITVEIKRGGTTYMRITDDGCGIAEQEIATAFLRHATSKITTKADLEDIHTLGFRGEALASVAAVARVEVLTKRHADAMGTSYRIAGSVEEECVRTGCPDGTTIVIRDLFYNVPVRQKFLKKDVTEGNAVVAILQKIALSHPEIAFQLIRDNKAEFYASGDGTLYTAIYAVYGKAFAQDLLPVSYEAEGITVSGFAIKPLYAKKNRAFQTFFVNGRYVKSLTCSVALEEAYRTLVMVGKFPACVLTLTIPPATVDVNVHPAKAEVRFSDEKRVAGAVYFAVKNALLQNGLIYEFQMKPTADWQKPVVESQSVEPMPLPSVPNPPTERLQPAEPVSIRSTPEPIIRVPAKTASVQNPLKPEAALTMASPKLSYATVRQTAQPVSEPQPEPSQKPKTDLSAFPFLQGAKLEKPAALPEPESESASPARMPIRVIGELFANYILAEAGDCLILIDKHAAHERVLFEQFLDQSHTPDCQLFMQGTEILLSMAELDALQSNAPRLAQMGFQFDFSNPPYVAVCAVPMSCAALNMDELVPELAENLALGKQNPQTSQLEDALHMLACKAAIRANDKNAICELQALADAVWHNEKIRHCPHGRPVLFSLTQHELEKQFKRV